MPVHKLFSFLSWFLVAALLAFLSLRLVAAPRPVSAPVAPAVWTAIHAEDLEKILTSEAALPAPSDIKPLPEVSSRLKLHGIIREQALTSGLALISIDEKQAKAYTVGQFISPGLQLVSLNSREAILEKDGQPTQLILPAKPPVKIQTAPPALPAPSQPR